MSTPRYVVKRVGDDFKVQRCDPDFKVNSAALAIGGGALALLGLGRGGFSGLTLATVGGLLLYRGVTGRNPLAKVADAASGIGPAKFKQGEPGPSHQHQHQIGQEQQTPQDPVEEMAMESFPASDPPAHGART